MPRSRVSRILVVAAALATCAPLPVAAQTADLADVVPHLKPGTSVRLTVDGQLLEGYIEHAAADGLVMRRWDADASERVAAARLQRLTYDDSTLKGGLIGLLVGAAPGITLGLLARTYCENEAGRCDAAPLIFGALTGAVGLGIGVGIDEAIQTTVRFGPVRVTAALGVVPDLRRPSARVSFRLPSPEPRAPVPAYSVR